MCGLDIAEQWGPERPLRRLRNVPISAPYIERMSRLLSEHAARLTETRDVPEADPPYKEYTIEFPAGTTRSDGLILLHACPFVIRFPDGFELQGSEYWSMDVGGSSRATIVLHLPKEEEPPKQGRGPKRPQRPQEKEEEA